MLIVENFLLALTSLRSNKMRALLTMLGIIIGISSVITIVSIGNSVSKNIENEIKKSGMNNISVSITARSSGDDESASAESPTADDMFSSSSIDDYEKEYSSDIKAISYEENVGDGEARMDAGKETQKKVTVNGVSNGYFTMNHVKLLKGRSINKNDDEHSSDVAVIPESAAKSLTSTDDNIIGQEIRVVFDDKILTYTIVGIYDDSTKSGSMFGGYNSNPTLYIPATAAMDVNSSSGIQFFSVMPSSANTASKLSSETESYFKKLYKSNKEFTVEVYNAQKDVNDVMSSINKIKAAIAVIAGIALLVGGIGVMNIMLVSVTERTREIGVRKAIGAKPSHIKPQFIIEAMIICGIGGIIGIILGLTVATIVALKMSLPVAISIPVIIISVAFSMGIGIFFGFYPANKAAKLDPIEALRYE